MLTTQEAQALLGNGGQVVTSDGEKIGKIGQVFLDDKTDEPAWVTVKTGLFGGAESFVPLDEATILGDDVAVPYDKDKVKDAPRVEDSEGHLDPSEEHELYAYYGLDHSAPAANLTQSGEAAVDGGRDSDGHTDGGMRGDGTSGEMGLSQVAETSAGHDTSGPDTDTAMTRSEEQLQVGKQTETVGKARLRKFIVTENVTQTVPVSHEEVRVVREPITEANRGDAMSGGELTEEDHEVELKGERLVVDKETVPVERVRMGTETVTEDQTVDEDVRKEQIEADTGDQGRSAGLTGDDETRR